MLCYNELVQKIESYTLLNKTMRKNLGNNPYFKSYLLNKEPRTLHAPSKKASQPVPIVTKKPRSYKLEELSSEIKKVKLTKDNPNINIVTVEKVAFSFV